MKTSRSVEKNRKNRIRPTHMLTTDIRQRCRKELSRGSIVFSLKVAGIMGYLKTRKQKPKNDPYLTPHTNINCK